MGVAVSPPFCRRPSLVAPLRLSPLLPAASKDEGFGRTTHRHREERAPRPIVPVPTEGPFKIFVRNLPYRSSRQDVGTAFTVAGEVKDVHLLTNKEGQPKGTGFVEFETRDALVAALALNGKVRAAEL